MNGRLLATALALLCALPALGAESTGGGGTYECWDRCTEEVGCNTTCYDSYNGSNSGPQITCGDYGSCDGGPVPPSCSANPCTNCVRPALGVNADFDGVPDALEYDLAYRFFPDVRLQWLESDLAQAYPYLGLTIPFKVRALPATGICAFDGGPNRCLEIRYGMAYRIDCGDNFNGWEGDGSCSANPAFPNTGHVGDAEFYAGVIRRVGSWTAAQNDASQWVMIRDFTAAHWLAATDGSRIGAYSYCSPACSQWSSNQSSCQAAGGLCHWFAGFCSGGIDAQYQSCSSHFTGESCSFAGGSCRWLPSSCSATSHCYSTTATAGHRTLFAAEGKHGLYHTDNECDSGGFNLPIIAGSDECPTNQYSLRNYITGRLQNIGESGQHAGFDTTIQHPDLCNPYDVWGNTSFGASSKYRDLFNYSLYWGLP